MRAKTILALLFLISLGVAASLYVHAVSRWGSARAAVGEHVVLVARAWLPSGTLLREEDVTWRPVIGAVEPGEIVRPLGYPETISEADKDARSAVYGAALRTGVVSGAPIRIGNIVKPGDREFLQIVLLPGKRAIAIPVSIAGAGTGLLFPGDSVDLILTQSFRDNAPLPRRSVSETVVSDLRVLSVDGYSAKAMGSGSSLGRTVTVEVTPEQAEKVSVANELGKLSLTLRGVQGAAAGRASDASKGTIIKATWAGDVSPALSGAVRPEKAVAAEPSKIEIIRGAKSQVVTIR